MSRYTSFGLDNNKRSKDRGTTGTKFCPWADLPPDDNGYTGHNVNVGLSMCFVHFVICVDCANSAFDLKNLHKWKVGECFRCKKKDIPCYFMRDPKEHWDDFSICKDCCNLAIKHLNEHGKETT